MKKTTQFTKTIASFCIAMLCFAFVSSAQSKQNPEGYISTVKKQKVEKVSSMNVDKANEQLIKIRPKKHAKYRIDDKNKRKLILVKD